jgi:hypothetical protein
MSTWPLLPGSSSVVDGGDTSEDAAMKIVGGRLLWWALTQPPEKPERPPTPDGALKAQALSANEVDERKRKIECNILHGR